MKLYEMTYKQYCQYWLKNAKYKNTYENSIDKWENKKRDLIIEWRNALLERALIGAIPSDVLMSYIRIFSEGDLFRTFRGIHSKGVENFRISKKIRDLRSDNE